MNVRTKLTKRLFEPRHLWGRLIVALVPVAVLGVWLKVLRIGSFYPDVRGLEFISKLISDVLFAVAWSLLWLVACYFASGKARAVLFYVAQLTTGVLGIFVVFNHEYMIRTGAPLTLAQMGYAWKQQGELGDLLSSQVSGSAIALLATIIVLTFGLPFVLGPAVSRRIQRRPRTRSVRFVLVAMVTLLIASGWSAPTASAAFALAAPVQLAVTPVRAALAYPEELGEADPSVDPSKTKLVASGTKQRNLVVITLESQRDSSTLPETKEPVTPVLDALAKQSLVPERGYTVMPHTSKALTAVNCGIVAPLDQENSEADAGSLPGRCLAELLGEQGYDTAFFQSATETFERRRGTVANLGYQDFIPVEEMPSAGFRTANYFGYEDDIMLEPQREWLEARGETPFLLSMLTVTAHHDYNLAGAEKIDFVDDPLLNSYLNGMHYQDQFVGKVIAMFKELGLYDDTVFVITGDHGEGFGEHRLYQHDNTIYEEGLRIPYLIHDPARAGEVVPGPANQLAVLPTAVDAIGFELETQDPYQPSLYSGTPQGPIVATCYARGKCTAVLDGDLKLIHHFGDRRNEVYDLSTDPFELTDISGQMDQEWIAERRDLALGWYLTAERTYENYRNR